MIGMYFNKTTGECGYEYLRYQLVGHIYMQLQEQVDAVEIERKHTPRGQEPKLSSWLSDEVGD